MKRILLLLIITVPVMSGAALAQPQLFLPEENFDFGNVDEGTTLEHFFEISNKGTETLIIKDVVPT